MGYDLRPSKGRKNLYVKCKWNSDCELCLAHLQDYANAIGMAEIPEFKMTEFFAPAEWYDANEKKGCAHGKQKLLKSAYV